VSDTAAVVDLFADGALETLAASGPIEVVAGVHVANQASHIVDVLDTVSSALEAYSPSQHAGVLVADAGSQDGTPDVIRAWCDSAGPGPSRACLDLIAPGHRGRAIRALLLAAHRLGARALVLLDADLTGVRKDWVHALLEPVLREEADYVSPAYARSVSEGTLTTNLLAPLTRALYGGQVQQMMGGCVAVAGAAFGSWLIPDVEAGDWQAHGAEMWLTTAALASGARIVEVELDRKLVTPGGPRPDLPTILVRTVGPLFALMERYEAAWLDRHQAMTVRRRGEPAPVEADVRSPAVEPMVRAFGLGLKDLLPVWEQIVPESTLARLYPLALLGADEFRLPPSLWARIVSDFAVAYHERRLPRDHLLRALTPLYLGRVAAFIVQARATPLERIPETFETIDRAFEDEKQHLVDRWR
jgi:glucosylglycerate synthase